MPEEEDYLDDDGQNIDTDDGGGVIDDAIRKHTYNTVKNKVDGTTGSAATGANQAAKGMSSKAAALGKTGLGTGVNAAGAATTGAATGAAAKAGTAAAAKGLGATLGSAGGPLGTILGTIAAEAASRVTSAIIKNWPYIALFFAVVIIGIMIFIFAMWHKIFGGSTFKTDVDLTSLSVPELAMKATEDPAKREEILNNYITEITKKKEEGVDPLEKINTAMPEEVAGPEHKKKMQNLITEFNTKFTELINLATEKKNAKYDFKKEPLTEEEFKKKNELETKFNDKSKELTTVFDKIKTESNKTDLVADKTANEKGFYNLNEFTDIKPEHKISPVSKDSFWGRAFTVSFTKVIYGDFAEGMIWIGDLSYPNGAINSEYANDNGRGAGIVLALSGPEFRVSNKSEYNQDKAKEVIQKLWQLGARRIWVPDSDLTKDAYTDIMGNSVKCEQMIGVSTDYWEVEVYN